MPLFGRVYHSLVLMVTWTLLIGCEPRRVPVTELRVELDVEPRSVSLSEPAAQVIFRITVRNPRWYPVEVHLGGPPIRYAADVSRDQGTTWGYQLEGIAPDSGGWTRRGRVQDMDSPLFALPPFGSGSMVDTLVVSEGRLRRQGRRRPTAFHDLSISNGQYEIVGSFNRLQTAPETLRVHR